MLKLPDSACILKNSKFFDFADIDGTIENVDIFCIAHGLSHTCRFGGQGFAFYSVAEHSVLVCDQAPDHLKKVALMHDASEALIADIVTPAKRLIGPAYYDLEEKIMQAVGRRFGFDWDYNEELKALDWRACVTEARYLFDLNEENDWTGDTESFHWSPMFLSPDDAYSAFLEKYLEVIEC